MGIFSKFYSSLNLQKPQRSGGLTFCYEHSCHGAELPFLFHSASVANFTLSPSEKLLSSRMLCYWGAFAHTGDPSSRSQQTTFCREKRLPIWPRYSDTSGFLVMNLTVRSHTQAGTRNHICDFWDQLDSKEWLFSLHCFVSKSRICRCLL
uniref:Carboxylesterase type B domain-containing protein n=1 Tax=Neolamprologus brichardi TaxID=32507 RepID=A0A3Q4M548_NEOBR